MFFSFDQNKIEDTENESSEDELDITAEQLLKDLNLVRIFVII
jgi:hypothetical protein